MKSDQELDALFAEMREDRWPDDRLVEWRAGIQEGRARRRFPWFWLLPVPALAAAAILFVLFRPQPAEAPMPAIARTPVTAQAPAAPGTRQPVAAKPTVRRAPVLRPTAPQQALLAKATTRGETQFMRIMTDDPDVVILWAVNGNGERQ